MYKLYAKIDDIWMEYGSFSNLVDAQYQIRIYNEGANQIPLENLKIEQE